MLLYPKKSRFGFKFQLDENDLDDPNEHLWHQSKQIFVTLVFFISESGPLQIDNLRTLLRLITGAILFGLDHFKAQELISLADNFLKLLTIVHKLRSKKPTHANSSAPKYH